uniref:DNA-(apurinic or apyrimidinic site) lyase n=1 Tax=Timema bartmani TaxID=61472 RepID=A0A7R9F9U1_9NEOP|nr:unnamed protein product [Timema bartmani]
MLDYVRGARKRHHEYLEMKQERSEEDKKKAYKRKLGTQGCRVVSVSKERSHVHRLYEDCLVRYNKLCQLDICSSEFDFPSANKLISSRPGKMVCDVIMDQDVLPGALFNSGINPNSTIGELTADLVSRLVHRLRDFSAIFYKCRKENKALSRYMKIYKKERCGECGGRVTVCKPGELKRITYFCASCQTNSVSNLPSTGSLLGFVVNSPITKEWACGRCTYINTYPSLVCAVCLQPNVDSKILCQTNMSNKGDDGSCMHTEPVSSDKHYSWPEPMLYNRKRQSNESEEYKQEKMPKLKATISEQGKENQCNKHTKKVSEKVSNEHKPSLVFASPGLPTVPVCLGHKVTCIKKQVTKASENQGRLFFVCSLPRLKQCHFFQWADLHHPLCAHKKVTVLRIKKLIVNQIVVQKNNLDTEFNLFIFV